MTREEQPSGAWLFGPVPDLLWGTGAAYLLVFSLILATGERVMSALPAWVLMLLVILVSIPHYGATLLRAYASEEERRAYRLFSTYATGALVLLFIWGIHDVRAGSVLFTIYLTWSPWHYTAQNYGIALTFLAKRGVEADPRTKRLLRLSILLPFWIAFLFMHGPATYSPFLGVHVQFRSMNLPALPVDVVLFGSLLLYGAATSLAVLAVARKGLRSTAPALGILLTQFVWFVLPAAVKNWFPYAGPPIFHPGYELYAFTWIALGHAIQYLWITAYFARASGRVSSPAAFYAKAVVCGCALWAMPLLLFSPGVLGSLPYDLGLAAMTAAMVNLHHFVLDGAIWKLRESRVRRVLLSTGAAAPGALSTRAHPLARPLAAAGVVSLAVLLFGAIEEEFGLLRGLRRGDLASAENSLDRLSWIGRDSSVTRAELGALRMRKGEAEAAERQIEIGLKVLPTATAWIQLGEARAFQGKSRGSMEAYRSALVLEPGNVTAKLLLGLAHAGVGESDRARTLLEQCDRRAEDTPAMRDLRNRLESALAVRPGA
jgi:hypothetical protein